MANKESAGYLTIYVDVTGALSLPTTSSPWRRSCLARAVLARKTATAAQALPLEGEGGAGGSLIQLFSNGIEQILLCEIAASWRSQVSLVDGCPSHFVSSHLVSLLNGAAARTSHVSSVV